MIDNKVIIGQNIDLRPVNVSDAAFILSLRTDHELSKYLSPVIDDLKLQEQWIVNNYKANEWYFIVQNKSAVPVGTIRIYDIIEDSFCWGSWIIKPIARQYASFESVVMIHELAFYELNMISARVDCRKQNQKSKNFQERFGYNIIKEDELNLYFSLSKYTYSLVREDYIRIIDKL